MFEWTDNRLKNSNNNEIRRWNATHVSCKWQCFKTNALNACIVKNTCISSNAGTKQCILFTWNKCVHVVHCCDEKMLGQKEIDFAVSAPLKFKNDKAKLAAAF